jgi:hypothetical protein
LLESAFLQRGLPFVSAVEAEGYELQLSLISDGVGLGLVMPQVFKSSALRKRIKPGHCERALSNAKRLDTAFQTHWKTGFGCPMCSGFGQTTVTDAWINRFLS